MHANAFKYQTIAKDLSLSKNGCSNNEIRYNLYSF